MPILEDKQVWGTSDDTKTAYLDSQDVARMALAALRCHTGYNDAVCNHCRLSACLATRNNRIEAGLAQSSCILPRRYWTLCWEIDLHIEQSGTVWAQEHVRSWSSDEAFHLKEVY